MYSLLSNFYSIDDFRNDLVCGHVLSLCLICKADTMAKDLVTYGTHIFRNDITSSLDECICLGCHRKRDARTWRCTI